MRYFIIILAFLFSLKIQSQSKCVCCAYHIIEFNDNFDDLFKSDLIKKQKIKTAIIYTTENYDTIKNLYIQAKFYFDINGRITIKKFFYKGSASTIVDYVRNAKGLVIKKTENYVDSLEQKSKFTSPKIYDYTYNDNGKLLKIKQRGDNGVIVQDKLSDYTDYEYDNLNRIIREYRYTYYEKDQTYIYDTKYIFDSLYISTAITKSNDKPWIKAITTYNKDFRILNQIEYSLPDLKKLDEKRYIYNDFNQLVSCFDSEGWFECPERGNVIDEYSYNKTGLIEEIAHRFRKVTCDMKVSYE